MKKPARRSRTHRIPFEQLLEIDEIRQMATEMEADGFEPPKNAVARLNKRSWTLKIKWKGTDRSRWNSSTTTWPRLPLP